MRSRTLPGSLAARAYLLAYDVERRKPTGDELSLVVRGAALVELSLRGGLTEDEGKVRASGTLRTGDPVLDDVLRDIGEAQPRSWQRWLRRGATQTYRAVRAQLVSAGVITVETDRVLGIFRRTTVTLIDPAPVKELQESLRTLLFGSGPMSTEDAVLVALANVGQLGATLSGKDRKAHRERIKELTAQAKAAVPVLGTVLGQIKAARSAKQSGG